MRAFDPNPEIKWLFLFAHPDDELAIAAWIRFLALNGNKVSMGWMHRTPVREEEARAAAERLKVNDLFFLEGEDGAIVDQLNLLAKPLNQEIQRRGPDRIATLAFEQGHLDHDATHFLARQLYTGQIFEFPLYHPYTTRTPKLGRFATPEGEETRNLSKAEIKFKIELAQSYPSQKIWRNLKWAQRRARLLGDDLRPSERMRIADTTDFRTPRQKPRMMKRVQRHENWRRWLTALSSFPESCLLSPGVEAVAWATSFEDA